MTWFNPQKIIAKAAENWLVKVISIALAIILFVFHRMSTLESRFFSVPLRVEHNASLIPASPYTRMIRVSLRGDANSIYPILDDDIEAYIDLRNYETEGLYHTPVQIRKKGTALGVDPLEITADPMEISLELDRRMSKYLPLTASLRGSVEEGYDLASQTLTPNQVTVDGPLRLLGNITELYTEEIDLDGRNADFSVMVNILNQNPLLVIRGNGMTEFRGFVQNRVSVRNFMGIPITVNGLAPQFAAEPDIKLGSIRAEGGQKELDAFVPPASFLSVDASAIEMPGTYTLPLDAVLPEGLNLVRQDPLEVSVTVTLNSGGDGPIDGDL
jgi:YbbR domain-containing protein